MSVTLSPPMFTQFFDPNNTGAPAAGFKLFTYQAGTSVKQATWTDSTQGVQNSNPLPLDASGGGNVWGDPTLGYKFVWAPANDTDPPSSPIRTVDNLYFPLSFAALTQGVLGLILYPRTAAEIAAGVTPTNYAYAPGVAYRYNAKGDGVTNDQAALANNFKLNINCFLYNGTYMLGSKLQWNVSNSIRGETRAFTIIQSSSGFADYVMEIGTGIDPAPTVGILERLRFYGVSGNLGMLHFNIHASEWHLNDLLFTGPITCPAIVCDTVWDSNWTNIEIINWQGSGSNPATNAAVILRNNCNNIYMRGVRLEQCKSGCLYISHSSPIHWATGKLDMGFVASQLAPAITLADGYSNGFFPATLFIDSIDINGVLGQYAIDTQGELHLGRVYFGGGNNVAAHIYDHRPWFHMDGNNFTGAARSSFGPIIPQLDLGRAHFGYGSPFNNTTTPAAVYSKIFPIRALANTSVTANGATTSNNRNIAISATIAYNDQYTGCYLVHNGTGTQASSRRLITGCFVGGSVYVQGTNSVTQDADWSIEYCGGHFTPNFNADQITLEAGTSASTNTLAGMDLFAKIATACTLSGTPTYQSAVGANYGTTTVTIAGTGLSANQDLTGFYLIDETTGEPFLIGYGMDGASIIGVMYDRTATLNTAHTFTVQAGYHANIKINGGSYEWTFAGKKKTCLITAADYAGFDINNIPLWGVMPQGNTFGANQITGEPVTLPYSASINVDASAGNEFIVTATNNTAFAINAPINVQNGQRLIFTIRNTSGGALGAVTWNAIFKLAAWASPATANSRSIEYRYDGTNLVEINRTPADVPN